VLERVREEVTTDPEATALDRFLDGHGVAVALPEDMIARGRSILGDDGVTGTIGVVGRAVMVGELDEAEAKTRLDRLERNGLHMTAELRRRADELIADAAENE